MYPSSGRKALTPPTWLCAKLYSTDGDVENIRDIFQTGLLSYHERGRDGDTRMSEMGAWDLFPSPSSSPAQLLDRRGICSLSQPSPPCSGAVCLGCQWGGRHGGVRVQGVWGGWWRNQGLGPILGSFQTKRQGGGGHLTGHGG